MDAQAAQVGRLRRVWELALPCATLLLVVGSFWQLQHKNALQRESAAHINISGRQRMLSQRATLLATQLVLAEGDQAAILREELGRLVDRFEFSHAALVHGSSSLGLSQPNSPAVRAIFNDKPYHLNAQVSQFVHRVRSFLEASAQNGSSDSLRRLVSTSFDSKLLPGLDALVARLQHESEANAAAGEWLLLFLVVIAVLSVTATLIVLAPRSPQFAGNARTLEEPTLSRASGLMSHLQNRAPVVLAVLFIAIGVAVYWSHCSVVSGVRESHALQEAEVRTKLLNRLRTVYTEDVVERLGERGVEASHDFATRSDTIPLPATLTMLVGSAATDVGFDVDVKLYSPHPFPWRGKSGGLRDGFKVDAWEALSANPGRPFVRVESHEGGDRLRYATADVMRPACVNCHNTHPDSPKRDWQVGDLRGVLEVTSPLSVNEQIAQAGLRNTLIMIFAIGLCGTGTIYLVTARFRQDGARLTRLRAATVAANRTLSSVNAELEQFAFVASHDLQEPLRKISSFCQLLREDHGHRLDQEGKEYLDVAIQGAERLRILVRDLLAFSRIATRGQPLGPTSANSCLQNAISNLEMTIEENRAQVTYDALPTVMADESQLVHLFQNLLGNAIKYRGNSAPEIHVGSCQRGKEFEFFVRDNGMGIEAEFHEKIFGIFQRLHNRREFSGTGIGLALCKRIVERFGGRIWVESTPGAGSTFYFTLKQVVKQGGRNARTRELASVGASH